ncbi:MAG: ankyrin repeat domain-containing protein [Gemmataceae bacterium]
MTEEQAKDIWYFLEQTSYHLQNPPPEGCWEHPEDVESVRRLLRENPNQVHEGDGGEWHTPLHKAAYLHLCDIAKVLLELGADPNACPPETGWTPLHIAVHRSEGEDRDAYFLQVLLDHDAEEILPGDRMIGAEPEAAAQTSGAIPARQVRPRREYHNAFVAQGLIEQVVRTLLQARQFLLLSVRRLATAAGRTFAAPHGGRDPTAQQGNQNRDGREERLLHGDDSGLLRRRPDKARRGHCLLSSAKTTKKLRISWKKMPTMCRRNSAPTGSDKGIGIGVHLPAAFYLPMGGGLRIGWPGCRGIRGPNGPAFGGLCAGSPG